MKVCLSEIAEFITDGTHGSPERVDIGIPVLSAQNVTGGVLSYSTGRYTTEAEYQLFKKRLDIAIGDVLLTIVGSIGRAAVVRESKPAVFQRSVAVIRPKRQIADPSYLLHLFHSNYFQSELYRNSNQSSQAGVYLGRLGSIEIPLPPLEEQRRIAAILDKADSIHRLAIDREGIWSKLTRALFYEMFGGVNTNPYGFRLATLGELLSSSEVFIDGDWVESKDQDPSGDVRLIQLADVGDGFYIDKSSRFLTYETSARLRCTYLKPGDILVARMPDPLCRACIFPGDERAAVTVVDVCIIRVDHSSVDPTWLTWMINSTEFRVNALRAASGTTRSRVSRGNLSKLPVLMPPLETQQHFAQISSKSLSLLGRQSDSYSQISSSHVKNLISSLSAEVFGGKQ